MEELTFRSSLTPEEIEKNFQDMDFFSGMMTGLEEALAHAPWIRNMSFFAVGVGLLRPLSHASTVRRETPSTAAKSFCVMARLSVRA